MIKLKKLWLRNTSSDAPPVKRKISYDTIGDEYTMFSDGVYKRFNTVFAISKVGAMMLADFAKQLNPSTKINSNSFDILERLADQVHREQIQDLQK